MTRWLIAVAFALSLFGVDSFPQCPLDSNGYVFFHPALKARNWLKAVYDSVDILFDNVCPLTPVRFDMCGSPAGAVAAFIAKSGDLYLSTSTYACFSGLCPRCVVEFAPPAKVDLGATALSQASPLYLVKNPAYGADSVKALVKSASGQVLSLAVSTATGAVLKMDSLALSAHGNQEILQINGEYDSLLQRDTAVWVLGSRGLARRFPLAGVQFGPEVKMDIAVMDTVFCTFGPYAGTSGGVIYKRNNGNAFVRDTQVTAGAIYNIFDRGAVGSNGAFLELENGKWTYYKLGTADYRFGAVIRRASGTGVEMLDAQWKNYVFTYRDYPSNIAAPIPASRNYPGGQDMQITATINDPDFNYSDLRITLNSGGSLTNLKNDGKHTIDTIPADSFCVVDSLRLKGNIITLTFTVDSVKVAASCELGKKNVQCGISYWSNYGFISAKKWKTFDMVTLSAGADNVVVVYNAAVTVTENRHALFPQRYASVSHGMVNGSLVFQIRQGTGQKLDRILLYDIRGRLIASMQAGKLSTISAPVSVACGMLYAKYLFSDGSSSHQSILLIH